jgi:O-antigen ligase
MAFAHSQNIEPPAPIVHFSVLPGFLKILALVSVCLFVLWPKFVVLPGVGANIYIAAQVALALLFVPCLIFRVIRRHYTVFSAQQMAIVLSFTGLIMLEFLSFIFGGPEASPEGYIRQIIGVKLMFLVGTIVSDDEKTISNLFKVIIFTLLVSFLVALWEQSARKTILAVVTQTLPIAMNDVITAMISDKIRGGTFRSGAFFDHPIILSIAASVAVPLGLMQAAQSRGWGKLFSIGFVVLALLAGYFTFSRTFVVGLIAGLGSYFMFRQVAAVRGGRGRAAIFGTLGLTLFLVLVLPEAINVVLGRTGLEQYSSSLRDVMWQRAAPYISERPFLGWGWGSDLSYAGIKRGVVTVDDSYLSLLVNNGIVGLVVLGVFVGTCLLRGLTLIVDQRSWVSQIGSVTCAIIILVLVCQKSNSIPAAFAFIYLFGGLLAGMKLRPRSIPTGNSSAIIRRSARPMRMRRPVS